MSNLNLQPSSFILTIYQAPKKTQKVQHPFTLTALQIAFVVMVEEASGSRSDKNSSNFPST